MANTKTKKAWTVLTMLEWATDYFEERSVPSPRLSIEWLLADLLGTSRLNLYLLHDRPLSDRELEQLRPAVRRRAGHEPLQYITGHCEFHDCRILTDPSVLIPRQETEQLVSLILEHESPRADQPITVADLGTGSGCIPIAIKKQRPGWSCIGVDISEPALQLARRSARLNDMEIEWRQDDLARLAEDSLMLPHINILISNPPYILPEEEEELEPQVIRHEPRLALIHSDPLRLYRAIGKIAVERLLPGGSLWLECNTRLTDEIAAHLRSQFLTVETLTDLDNRNRFILAKKSP